MDKSQSPKNNLEDIDANFLLNTILSLVRNFCVMNNLHVTKDIIQIYLPYRLFLMAKDRLDGNYFKINLVIATKEEIAATCSSREKSDAFFAERKKDIECNLNVSPYHSIVLSVSNFYERDITPLTYPLEGKYIDAFIDKELKSIDLTKLYDKIK